MLFSLSKNFRALAQIGRSDIAWLSTRELVKPKELNLANVFYLIFYLIWLLLLLLLSLLYYVVLWLCVFSSCFPSSWKIVITRITRPMPGLGLGRQRQSNRLMARTEHKINAINVIKSLTCIIVWDEFSLRLSFSFCLLSCCFQVVSFSIKYVICSVFRCFFAVNQLRWEIW